MRPRNSTLALVLPATAAFILSCGESGGGSGTPTLVPDTIVAVTEIPDTATVDTTLTPTFLVLDQNGDPLPGIEVAFEVTLGGGELAAAVDTSDGSGEVHPSWGLDTLSGENSFRVAVDGDVAPVEITVYGSPGVVVGLLKLVGDSQQAAPSSEIPIPPTVRAVDVFGNGVPGVPVIFAITAGGGAVAGEESNTNGAGTALLPMWVLGPADSTVNSVSAAIPGPFSVTFTALAVAAIPPVHITINAPFPSQKVADTLRVAATIASDIQIDTVRAWIGGVDSPLVYVPARGRWERTLDISSLPDGPQTLRVRARNAFGAADTAEQNAIIDPVATIEFVAPRLLTVLPAAFRVTARCTDTPGPPCKITVLAGSPTGTRLVLATGDSVVDTVVSLPPPLNNSHATKIGISVTEAGGRVIEPPWRQVYITYPGLTEVASADGLVLDYDGERMVALSEDSAVVEVLDLVGVSRDTIPMATPHGWQRGELTPLGAMFADFVPGTGYVLHDFRSGTTTKTTLLQNGNNPPFYLRVAGGHAIFLVDAGNPDALMYRDPVTGTTSTVVAARARGDVASNGDVVYSTQGAVHRLRGGVDSIVSSLTDSAGDNDPVTDGAQIAFERIRSGPGGISAFFDGDSIIELDTIVQTGTRLSHNYQYYGVNNGWVAYVTPTGGTFNQVWTRSPSGVLRQASFFGRHTTLQGVGADGSVIVYDDSEFYYIGPVSAVPIKVGHGRFRWIDGAWYRMLGRTVHRIDP
jgi:hypothetical protein